METELGRECETLAGWRVCCFPRGGQDRAPEMADFIKGLRKVKKEKVLGSEVGSRAGPASPVQQQASHPAALCALQ